MMKKLFACLALSYISVACTPTFAVPVNLEVHKQELKSYYASGQYMHDIDAVGQQALDYLKTRLADKNAQNKKLAIVLDIDETSLSNYPDLVKLDFGGSVDQIRANEDKGNDQAIPATLALYRYAKAHHVAIFFITGRFESERKVTADNLQHAGYSSWDKLILRYDQYLHVPAEVYKTAMRKAMTEQGYDIVLNIGDQNSDLIGSYADKTFKLSNPFYYIK